MASGSGASVKENPSKTASFTHLYNLYSVREVRSDLSFKVREQRTSMVKPIVQLSFHHKDADWIEYLQKK